MSSDKYKPGDKVLFLTSWPYGELMPVEIIQRRNDGHLQSNEYYYIRYENDGTDTTNTDFLFDIPESFAS